MQVASAKRFLLYCVAFAVVWCVVLNLYGMIFSFDSLLLLVLLCCGVLSHCCCCASVLCCCWCCAAVLWCCWYLLLCWLCCIMCWDEMSFDTFCCAMLRQMGCWTWCDASAMGGQLEQIQTMGSVIRSYLWSLDGGLGYLGHYVLWLGALSWVRRNYQQPLGVWNSTSQLNEL